MTQCDIRQLAVVTGFEPLEVYLYDEFYVRLCAENYAPGKAAENLQMCLANNSISKFSSEKRVFHENMMFMKEFEELVEVGGVEPRKRAKGRRTSKGSKRGSLNWPSVLL